MRGITQALTGTSGVTVGSSVRGTARVFMKLYGLPRGENRDTKSGTVRGPCG